MNAAPIPHERAAKKLLPLKGTEQARLLINDGTNSVIEFLRSAKDALPRDRVLPVLLVEIRNSDDIDDTQVPTPTLTRPTLFFSPTHQANRTNPDPRKTVSTPPPANHRELDLSGCAFDSQLSIDHLVFDYQQQIAYQKGHEQHTPNPQIDTGERELDQPLSWHLTKREGAPCLAFETWDPLLTSMDLFRS
jgi:hypothetical protein